MKVFLQAIVGQILFNLYFAYRGGQALPKEGPWRKGLYALLAVEFLLYMVGFSLHLHLPKPVMEFIMTVCGTWYFASIYMCMGLLLMELIRLIDYLTVKRLTHLSKRTYGRLKLSLLLVIPLASGLLIVWGYGLVQHPEVTYRTIQLDKPIGNEQNKLRLILITDIHMSETITRPYVERLVTLCNEQKPDLILVGGDIFDYYSHYGYKDGIPDLMNRMNPPLGTYYVLGNHEYRADMQAKIDWIPLAGGVLLRDSVAQPGGLINLVGRDDAINKQRAELSELVGRIEPDKRHLPLVLLDHQPRALKQLPANGVDLGLFGHTHNGQIFPFSIVTDLAFENSYGYSRAGKSHVFVSCGYGAAGPAIRLFTKSEIVVIDLLGA